MIERFYDHEFQILSQPCDGYPLTKYYYYRIYTGDKDYIESDGNRFDTEQEARFAVIGHITQLENGE